MAEIGIDISNNSSDHISTLKGQDFHWVVSLCDDADERYPSVFNDAQRTHIPFDEPHRAMGNEEDCITVYRQARDQIRQQLGVFLSARQIKL